MKSLQLSPATAASELIARRAARQSLEGFSRYILPGYQHSAHLGLIDDALARVLDGECKRLMVLMPPRHGKSEKVSRHFPAWTLGHRPSAQIIAASYGKELAVDMGRAVRNLMMSTDYQNIFPGVDLSKDSRAADRWNTAQGGRYVAAGVNTAITGRGADILLIDDPLKSRQDADSETYRRRLWDWYTSVAYTRQMPGFSIILVQTRWHDDDLAGRILADADAGGEQWEVIKMPAIDEAGTALWPERYPIEVLENIRRTIGPRDWNALYQQDPAPDEGLFFRGEWLVEVDELPPLDTLTVYGGSDYATKDGMGDYTVHLVVGLDQQGGLWLLDVWRKQATSDRWVDAWCDLVLRWRPREWGEEKGQILNSVGPYLEARQRERAAFTYRRQFGSALDKSARAQSIRGRIATVGLRIPRAAPWAAAFIAEYLRFPAAANDDQIDALARVGQLLGDMAPLRVLPPPRQMETPSSVYG